MPTVETVQESDRVSCFPVFYSLSGTSLEMCPNFYLLLDSRASQYATGLIPDYELALVVVFPRLLTTTNEE